MHCATDPKVSLRDLGMVRRQPGDQLLQVLRRHVILRDDQIRTACKQRDRLEILHDIVLERVDGAIGDELISGREAKRVAIGRGARDATDTDIAGRTAHILDHHGSTQRRRHRFRQDARKHIDGPARRKGYYHGNWTRRIGLRPCNARHGRESDGTRCQMQKLTAVKCHGGLSRKCWRRMRAGGIGGTNQVDF